MRVKRVLDRGETLVELLVAVTILGMTVLAAIGGLTTSIMASDKHQEACDGRRPTSRIR